MNIFARAGPYVYARGRGLWQHRCGYKRVAGRAAATEAGESVGARGGGGRTAGRESVTAAATGWRYRAVRLLGGSRGGASGLISTRAHAFASFFLRRSA